MESEDNITVTNDMDNTMLFTGSYSSHHRCSCPWCREPEYDTCWHCGGSGRIARYRPYWTTPYWGDWRITYTNTDGTSNKVLDK